MEVTRKPIFLVGFMASGKTTLGRILAKELKTEFVDSDEAISKLAGISIDEIFKNRGEVYFRNLEWDFIQNFTSNKKMSVVATGGGMPCYNHMMDVLNNNGLTVYIKTSSHTIFNRLLANHNHRPLIMGMESAQLRKFIDHTLNEREPIYSKSKIVVNGDLDLDETVQNILNSLNKIHENG